MKRSLVVCSALLCLLGACTPALRQAPPPAAEPSPSSAAPGGGRAEFDAFVDGLDLRRGQVSAWTEEEWTAFAACMPDYAGQLEAFTEQEVDLLTRRREPRALSREEAREDTETFFTLLRTTYAGYDYFGGDEVFLPLRDQALAGLPDAGEVTAGELEALLYQAVQAVIVDGHFTVGSSGGSESARRYMYYVPGLYFQDPGGLDPAYVRPTIGPDGAICHCFAALSRDGGDLPRTAVLPGGETAELDWVRAQPFEGWSEEGRIPYERRSVGGLPVLICETLDDSAEPQPLLEFLGNSGGEYRTLPVFAADLRGNWGGNDGYAQQWMMGFTGYWPQAKLAGGVKFSQLCMAVRGDYESQRQRELGAPPGTWGAVRSNGMRYSNESPVFLLADCETASSGEDFISYLRTVDHVVMVGSNTAGCQTFGNVMDFYLPRSGLRVRVGASFLFWDTAENREGVGYLPDLWVNPPDALEAVVRLCDYYGLK